MGEALSSIREEYGISIEEMSRATRIRASLIRQIEADDFTGCGGSTYAKGHVRAIAGYLDLDPEPLVRQYERVHGSDDVPAPSEVFEREVIASKHRTTPNWTAAMAVAAAILLVVAVISIVNPGKPSHSTLTQVSTPTSVTSSEPAPSVNTAPSTGNEVAGLLAATGVNVRVRITGTKCWVQAFENGVSLKYGTFHAGDVVDIHGERLVKLVLGNASAVSLVVNGHDIGTPGGTVVTLSFGPNDPDGVSNG